MFEDITPEGIKSRILGRLTTNLQTREGSFTNDVVSAMAAEISEVYHAMDGFLPAFYVNENSGQYIEIQAAAVGITRKPGTAAECSIRFTGTDGAVVPAGAIFYTAGGLAFYLQKTVTVTDGVAEGVLQAAHPGDAYNIETGEITVAQHNYSGITSYENDVALGGTDPESDAALLSRYQASRKRPSTSGNPYHYQQWATEVNGIQAARVISKCDGPGTVKVVLAGKGMLIPDGGAVAAAKQHIDEERPVGPDVTVVAADEYKLDVAATVTIDSTTNIETVRSTLNTAVKDYFYELSQNAFTDNVDLQFETMEQKAYTVFYNRIAFLLLSIPGVSDYSELKLNGETKNIIIPADALPILTEVTVK